VAVIRLAEAPPVRSVRRFRLDTPTMLALQDRAGVPLPADVRVDVDPVGARVAGVDLRTVVDDGVTRLRAHGVLDDEDLPLPAVLDNLRGVVGAPRRMRTTYAGPGRALVAYHWVGADLGGSLCRDGDRFEISLCDARSLGDEVSRLLPDQLAVDGGERAPFTLPLDELGTLAAAEHRVSPRTDRPAGRADGGRRRSAGHGPVVGARVPLCAPQHRPRPGPRSAREVSLVGRGAPIKKVDKDKAAIEATIVVYRRATKASLSQERKRPALVQIKAAVSEPYATKYARQLAGERSLGLVMRGSKTYTPAASRWPGPRPRCSPAGTAPAPTSSTSTPSRSRR